MVFELRDFGGFRARPFLCAREPELPIVLCKLIGPVEQRLPYDWRCGSIVVGSP